MNQFNLQEHHAKAMEISRQAAKGTYPNAKIAKNGSRIGMVVGGILCLIGIIHAFGGGLLWLGSFLTGTVTILSNALNLKRIKSHSK